MKMHPGNKTTNTSGANSTFLSGECQKELDVPVIIDAYNQNKVGVDVADQYQTYFDTQLISRHNLYPLLYWILETTLINSLIIYRNLPANTERTLDYFNIHLSIVHDLPQAGRPLTMKSSSHILASLKIALSTPPTHSAPPPQPTRQVPKHTPLPLQ
jgi:hypothetical protein